MPARSSVPARSSGGPERAVAAAGWVVVTAGALVVVGALVLAPAGRDLVAGWGLAAVMSGLLVVVLGNYLRHAVDRRAVDRGRRSGQPSSVPTTETNETISPG